MQPPRKRITRPQLDDAGLNLAPIMSMLTILIPVILITFSFFEIKVHAVTAPRMNTGPSQATPPKKLRPTVFLEVDHIRVTAQTLPQPIIVPMAADGSYDFKAVAGHITTLKKSAQPSDKTVYVGAFAGVHWKHLARAMDAVSVSAPLEGKVKKAPRLFEKVVLVIE